MSAHARVVPSYDRLVHDALHAAFQGWDFGWLADRTSGGALPWSYADLARDALGSATRALDLDTGGGELLASLAPFQAYATATEAWEPNVTTARARLEPLGIDIRAAEPDGPIPAHTGEFDLVLDRHGRLDPAELARVLRPGGRLLTQQVGRFNDLELNRALGGPPPAAPAGTAPATLTEATRALQDNGFRVVTARETMTPYAFHDIGAVVFQLRAVPWQLPGFQVERYDAKLRALDDRIRREGRFVVRNHRYLVEAIRDTAI